jgi:hypothetical protein
MAGVISMTNVMVPIAIPRYTGAAMRRIRTALHATILSDNFDLFLTELTMRFWNRIGAETSSGPLTPKDFIQFYEALGKALRPYIRPASISCGGAMPKH